MGVPTRDMVINGLTHLINMMATYFDSPIIHDIKGKMKAPLYVAGEVPDSLVQHIFMVPEESDEWGIWR